MPESALDVAVIGGGHAGLATSYELANAGLRHVVFEKGRIGETWRTQRWDSFALNSPNKYNTLPGDTYQGPDPDGFGTAASFVSYLEDYASRNRLPVEENTRVKSVVRSGDAFHLTVESAGATQRFVSNQVVIASGSMNELRLPLFASAISPKILQIHAGSYRSPAALPRGAVLVVGSAQSGLQVAEDLLGAGRRVFLSTSEVGRVPRRYRGKDILEWLIEVGFYDAKTEDVTDPKILDIKQPQVSGVGPAGHTVSLQALAARGAVILGKAYCAKDRVITLQPDAADHVRFSDGFSGSVKIMIDQFISEHKVNAPEPEHDPADEPDPEAAFTSAATSLDLRKEGITSIVWATGFSGDYSYLMGHPFDKRGMPVHRNGITNFPGLYVMGVPWLRKRKSGIVWGVNDDAPFIGECVRLFLASDNAPAPSPVAPGI